MKAVLLVARQTVLEILRARVLVALMVALAVMLWGSVFIGGLTFDSRTAVAADLGVTGSSFFGAILAILLAAEYVGASVQPVSWPLLAAGIGPGRLFLGRWLAVVFVVIGLSAAPPLVLAWLLSGPDAASGTGAFLTSTPQTTALAAAILLPLEALLLASLTAALAVSFPRPMALSLAFGAWIACHLHPDALTFVILYPGWPGDVLQLLGNLAPDLELYNPRLQDLSNLAFVQAAVLQSLLFSAAAALTGTLYLRNRDI